ncbi:MAG: MarR family transcriptional regulator [Syntrophorhabdales bacterium]|jgi:DNA-binding MarR family transcriptional regulator
MRRTGRDFQISETVQFLRRIFKAIQDYSQDVSNSFGITGPQLWALKIVSRHAGLALGDLSGKMYLHPSTVTGVIDRLESKGYVVRDRDSADRRVVKVKLTPAGQDLAAKAPNPIQGKMIYGLTKLSEDELNTIYESVKRLAELAEAKNVKATFFFDQE